MPKHTGAAYSRQLRHATSLLDRMLLCTYGRLFPSDAVALVALVTACDDIEQRVRRYDREGGGPAAWNRITSDYARSSLAGENIQTFRDYAVGTRRRMERFILAQVPRAILASDPTLFEQLAELVDARRANGGKPFDLLGTTILFLLGEKLCLEDRTQSTARLPMTETEVVRFLHQTLPELSEKADLPREVRRKCDDLGISLAHSKRGRPSGSRNRQGYSLRVAKIPARDETGRWTG